MLPSFCGFLVIWLRTNAIVRWLSSVPVISINKVINYHFDQKKNLNSTPTILYFCHFGVKLCHFSKRNHKVYFCIIIWFFCTIFNISFTFWKWGKIFKLHAITFFSKLKNDTTIKQNKDYGTQGVIFFYFVDLEQ